MIALNGPEKNGAWEGGKRGDRMSGVWCLADGQLMGREGCREGRENRG